MAATLDIWKAALAGLLHDIGKLGQRAREVGTGGRRDHASIGDAFVARYVPQPWQQALAPVGWHHGDPDQPQRPLELPVNIVRLADRLSAGERISPPCPTCRSTKTDRVGAETFRCEHGHTFPYELPPQLIPVLDRISHPPSPRFFGLQPLCLHEAVVFPRDPLAPAAQENAYQNLWKRLTDEMRALQQVHQTAEPDLATYVESVLALLQKYTWCVPSAFYYDVPDVSLYDHSRTTAALAAVLTRTFGQNEGVVGRLLDKTHGDPASWPEEPPVAGLLAGDLSGIQTFLYDLHDPKGAAALLRARSFYLQMLTETVARWILRQLDLPVTNILYVGGGTFTLIVPPVLGLDVDELACQVNEVLFQAHQGALYMALAHVALVPRDFASGKPGDQESRLVQRMRELHEKLRKKKNKRFAELPAASLRKLFEPQGEGGGAEGVCSVCGLESANLVEEEETRWCPRCTAFRELGRDLRRAQYLLLREVDSVSLPPEPTWSHVLRAFGAEVEVYENFPRADNHRSVLWMLTDEPKGLKFQPRQALVRKFIVNTVPLRREGEDLPKEYQTEVNVGAIKHFGVLARQSKGAPYLGVLRMDADNLGRLFAQGLGPYHTLSRYASLSFSLSLFFEGWVGQKAAWLSQDGERLYAVYSGGDDLFFAGSWDAVLELAQHVRSDFRRFVGGGQPSVSGGLVLVHDKYPLYLAAHKAGEAEDQAKRLRKEKDAFSFLGMAMGWEEFGTDKEEGPAARWSHRLAELMGKGEAPRTVVRKIQDLYFMYEQGRPTRGPWGPWIWRGAYWLARAHERISDPEVRQTLAELMDLLQGENFGKNIRWLALAARWAELSTREGGNRE